MDWLFFVLVILSFTASIQTFRIYKLTEIMNYFHFSLVFLFLGLNTLLISLGYFASLPEFTTFLLYMFFLYFIHLKLEIANKLPKIKLGILFYGILSIFVILSFFTGNDFSEYFRFIITDIILIIVASKIILVHLHAKIYYKTKRSRIAKYTWLIVGITSVAIGFVRGIAFILASIDSLFNGTPTTLNHPYIEATYPIITIVYAIFVLTILGIIFFTPGILILREEHISQILKLYKVLEQNDQKSIPRSLEQIISYLNEISEQFDDLS